MSNTASPPPPGYIRLGTSSPSTGPTTAVTLQQIHSLAIRAADSHIDILLLPEAYIGGYPRGSAFGCVIGGRSAEGRDEFLKYFETAVDLGDSVGEGAGGGDSWVKRAMEGDGVKGLEEKEGGRGDGTREELERIAAETGVFIVVGLIEKAGGSLYCAVVYVCPQRGMIGKRRKVMPTGTERLIWAQGSPRTLRAVSTVIRGIRVNMAAAICWENYMPLLRQALYAQNVNLYLAPTADGRDAWLGLMRTVGVEGRCFVVSSNMCVRDKAGDANSSGSAVIDDGESADQGPYGSRARRKSLVTEEGFEIALPSHSAEGKNHVQKRRKSVIDENGNEIVLCCKEGTGANGTTIEVNNIPSDKVNGATTKKNGPSEEFISRGGSSIVSPFGDVLAGPQWEDDEGIIHADVDFKDCIRGDWILMLLGATPGKTLRDDAFLYWEVADRPRNDSFKFSVEGLNLTPLPY